MRISIRDRLLGVFGALTAGLIGMALVVRSEQLNSFTSISDVEMRSRRATVEYLVDSLNLEVSSVLDRSEHSSNPGTWTRSTDPLLACAMVGKTQIQRNGALGNFVEMTDDRLRELASKSRSLDRFAFSLKGIPVEVFGRQVSGGTALALRVWDDERLNWFERLSNARTAFIPGKVKSLQEEDSSAVFRSLKSADGAQLGRLTFLIQASAVSEAKESANETAGLIICGSLAAFGLLFLALHRLVLEPLRIMSSAIKGESVLSHSASNDEFGEAMDRLNRVFFHRDFLISANEELEHAVRNRTRDLEEAYDSTIAGFSLAMELRDKETEGHCQRVAIMATRLAEKLGLPNSEVAAVRRGALLHDVGKLGIPDSILLKTDGLTPEEQLQMQRHTLLGCDMLRSIPFLKDCLDIPRYHHEKWDGTGYPEGLRGEAIPLHARIFAFADVYDALRSDRPYRAGLSDFAVRTFIREQAGKHFDPSLTEVFLRLDFNDLWNSEADAPQAA